MAGAKVRMHPDGVARLLAAIFLDGDRKLSRGRASDEEILDARYDQFLGMAAAYYRCHPQDYDGSHDGIPVQRGSRNNLAKLNRANLR